MESIKKKIDKMVPRTEVETAQYILEALLTYPLDPTYPPFKNWLTSYVKALLKEAKKLEDKP